MISNNCNNLINIFRAQLEHRIQAKPLDQKSCIVDTPFLDHMGDPIKIAMTREDGTVILDDTGTLAGQLFSMGQHTGDTPASKLLSALAAAYGLEIDYNEGLVKSVVSEELLFEGIIDFLKVILAVVTVTPHIRVHPHRLKMLGARVRAKIRKHYEIKNVLKLVEPYYEIRGTTVDAWPIDFHWQVRGDNGARDVFVVALDLDVTEPLKKPERIAALAIDAKDVLENNYLRIAFDTHGQNSQSKVAAAFLKHHSKELNYRVFDFGVPKDVDQFLNQSVGEVLGEAGKHWREFWQARSLSDIQ